MIAYRKDERICDTGGELTALRRQAGLAGSGSSHDAVVGLAIDVAEFESAVADALFPDHDGLHPLTSTLRLASAAAGRALVASWKQEADAVGAALDALVRHLDALTVHRLPQSIPTRVSEGYAYYALHPETYALAAARFAAECAPVSAVCIGVRGIGTSLSAVVAASLERLGIDVDLYSVRPHGHPFDRRLDLDESLSRALVDRPRGCYFLAVDEGPGLSGSSFASVARALVDLGVESARIVFFPSWNPDGSALRSADARRTWREHRRYCATAEEAGVAIANAADTNTGDSVDFSGGAWRPHCLPDETSWPAVQPQHEVAKIWIPRSQSIVRFAGLGRYGAAKRARAEALAAGGIGARPEWLKGGYLSMPFIEGVSSREANEPLLDAIADHIAFVVRSFPSTRSPEVAALEEMIENNTRTGLGDGSPVPRLAGFRTALADAPSAAIDGRMRPCEWLDTRRSSGARAQDTHSTSAAARPFHKTDALDHHADHFFPGVQDAGWDLAMAAFEFSLDAAATRRMVDRYAHATGDRDVAVRLPFFQLAYPAFRLGYATLARGSVDGSEDAARFDRVIEACRRELHRRLTAPSAP